MDKILEVFCLTRNSFSYGATNQILKKKIILHCRNNFFLFTPTLKFCEVKKKWEKDLILIFFWPPQKIFAKKSTEQGTKKLSPNCDQPDQKNWPKLHTPPHPTPSKPLSLT
jgi:hypothetical protein